MEEIFARVVAERGVGKYPQDFWLQERRAASGAVSVRGAGSISCREIWSPPEELGNAREVRSLV